jgi:hypothetical protein
MNGSGRRVAPVSNTDPDPAAQDGSDRCRRFYPAAGVYRVQARPERVPAHATESSCGPDNERPLLLSARAHYPPVCIPPDPLVHCIRPAYLTLAQDDRLTPRPYTISAFFQENTIHKHQSTMANLSKDDLQNLGRAPSKCVGPEYKDSKDKPTATVSTEIPHANVHILPQTPQLISLLTYVSSGPSKPNQLQSKID